MGQNQQRYYERHREEILAKAKAKRIEKEYTPEEYQKKLDYNREYYKRKRASMTNEEIESKNKDSNINYKEKHRTKSAIQKEWLKPYKEKFKGFVFKFDDDILTIEIKLPFRIIATDAYGVNHCDEDKIYKLQQELRRDVLKIYNHKHLIVIDCNAIQLFLTNLDNLEEICELVKNKVLENLKKYGYYYKNGKQMGIEWKDQWKNGDQ